MSWTPDARVSHTQVAYMSGGARITVDRVAPPRSGPHPVVLVLHPSDGLDGSGGQYVRRYADQFALNGYVAYVVHYFDRTGTTRSSDALEDKEYPIWTAALRDAVTLAQHDPAVDPRRIGAFGYSLGGYMALALGATDPRVKGLVVLSGGFFDTLAPEVRRLPPTLLIHGDDDRTVPLDEARKVDATLTRLGVTHTLVVYAGDGHRLTPQRDPEVAVRAIRFLDRHTGGQWWRRLTPWRSAERSSDSLAAPALRATN